MMRLKSSFSLWGKDGYPIGVAGYETDKLLIIDPKNY